MQLYPKKMVKTLVYVKRLIFSIVVGIHRVSLQKNVTHPKYCTKRLSSRFLEHIFSGQPLNGCFLRNIVESPDKKSNIA